MSELRAIEERGREAIQADFLVVGSGIAGLWTAIRLAEQGSVALVTKDHLVESSTFYAQGGIAVALYPEDSPEQHLADTLIAGAGLCDEPAVEVLTREGPRLIERLVAMGAQFDMAGDRFALTREAAHRSNRILHADGDATGREVESCLADRARTVERIHPYERLFVQELLLREDRTCAGVLARDLVRGRDVLIRARATVIATGGIGEVYGVTTNPPVTTGDGIAAAFRAGAAVQDLEFVQFHPTALSLPDAPRFLISEAARGEGAVLRNNAGERFMPCYHPDAELAPRDIVSRAIWQEMADTGQDHVLIDFTGLDRERVARRFPTIAARCLEYGKDITRDLVPVAPAAHYLMGGIATDLHGRTTLPGLYACGECASCGIHGANRLASNSLLDGIVYGDRCAEAMFGESEHADGPLFGRSPFDAGCLGPPDLRPRVHCVAWRDVGIIRSAASLEAARRDASEWLARPPVAEGDIEVGNMALVTFLMASAALARTESRGAHYREDYPEPQDPAWRKHIVLQRGLDTGLRLTYAAVSN
ncbi:MAG: L-aspartate oxidase [Armatimonadetes bacterium]|nr:L-aspartate oxidase [Armatimonadota bacterium]